MNQGNNTELKRRGHRCDQCCKSHSKCDRLLPECSRCIKKNLKCTLNRKIVYNKDEDTEYKPRRKSTPSKPKISSKDDMLYVNENVSSLRQHYSEEVKYRLLKLPNNYNFSYNTLGLFNQFQRKSLLENLLNFIQNPSPFFPSKGLNLFIILTDKLGLLTYKPKKTTFIFELIPKGTKTNVGTILKQALANYFKFVNKAFPLFDEIRFDFLACSFNLKSAILLSGLLYMEQTEIVKNLIKYFEGKLYNLVSNVPRIKSNLENIQIILILIGGIPYFPWINSLKEFLLFHCYRISFIIGLNQSPKKVSNKANIERVYTYCVLNLYYNGMLLLFGTYVAEPTFPLMIKRLDKHYTHKYQNQLDFNRNSVYVQKHCFLKLQEFYYISSTIFFDLRIIKERSTREKEDQLKLQGILKKISFKIFAVKERYVGIMQDILLKIKDQSLKTILNDYQNSIAYFFQHINFCIHSIQFNISKEKKLYEMNEYGVDTNMYTDRPTRIKTILKQCYSVIDSTIANNHKYTLTLDCPIVSTCLVFIIRYGGYTEENIRYIHKGKGFLKSLLGTPSALRICGINLKLIEIIIKSLNNIKIK
ncbi:hypothetical protein K502DRAFT_352963 [Neoconidiobolus thromboides FSU 785]|nr:hypothetical protein K502DRAFT_352963 [Neoconidiobolus thromboides FSU 785]